MFRVTPPNHIGINLHSCFICRNFITVTTKFRHFTTACIIYVSINHCDPSSTANAKIVDTSELGSKSGCANGLPLHRIYCRWSQRPLILVYTSLPQATVRRKVIQRGLICKFLSNITNIPLIRSTRVQHIQTSDLRRIISCMLRACMVWLHILMGASTCASHAQEKK